MVRVAVASANPVKVKAVQEAFEVMFPQGRFVVEGVAVISSVRAQPWSDGETLLGAFSRVEALQQQCPAADVFVGIEGGVEEVGGQVASFGWVVVQLAIHRSKAKTGTFFLPRAVATLLKQGYELGDADDVVFGTANSKQGLGAIGLLTGGVLTRTTLYRDAVIAALVPFRNPELY